MTERFTKASELGLSMVDGDRELDKSERKIAEAAFQLGESQALERVAELLLRGGHYFPERVDIAIRQALKSAATTTEPGGAE